MHLPRKIINADKFISGGKREKCSQKIIIKTALLLFICWQSDVFCHALSCFILPPLLYNVRKAPERDSPRRQQENFRSLERGGFFFPRIKINLTHPRLALKSCRNEKLNFCRSLKSRRREKKEKCFEKGFAFAIK